MKCKNKKCAELLAEASELVVTLRSWNLHATGPLMTRQADTGAAVGGSALSIGAR